MYEWSSAGVLKEDLLIYLGFRNANDLCTFTHNFGEFQYSLIENA